MQICADPKRKVTRARGRNPRRSYTLHSNQTRETVWESESACAQNHLARVSSLGPFSVLEIRFCPMPTKSGLP